MSNVPVWAYILVGLLGGGAIALTNLISKLIEIKAAARQKRTDNFLQNSQPCLETLYKPIDTSLSQLEDSYRLYKRGKGFLKSARLGKVTISPPVSQDETNARVKSNIPAFRAVTEEDLEDFYKAYVNLRDLVTEINADGRGTQLPREFHERLRSFVQFLKIPTDDYWLIASTGKDIEGSLIIDQKSFEKRFLTDMHYFKTFISEVRLGTAMVSKQ